MATNYDIAFLRLLMQRQVMEKPQAMGCLQVIDQQQAQGRTVNAREVVVRMGVLDEAQAQQFDALTQQELQRAGGGAPAPAGTGLTGRFQKVTDAPPQPAGLPAAQPLPVPTPGPVPTPAPVPQAAPPPQAAPLPAPAAAPQPSGAGRVSGAGKIEDGWYELGGDLEGFACGPKIGRGPVGTTYQGKRIEDNAPCVIKVISRRFREHPELLKEVLSELELWKGLRHPNLAAPLAVGVSNDRDMAIYRRAPGKPVRQVLESEGPLKPMQAMKVIFQLSQVLKLAGERRGIAAGVIHADKVYYDGQQAVLVDVGQARSSCIAAGHGRHGMSFGDPAYLAPEILQVPLTEPNAATDVYALGILAYQLLCGRLPYEGEVMEVLKQHFESPLPPPPADVRFNPTLAGLILRMTAKSPAQRLPDAESVGTAITALLEGKPIVLPKKRAAEQAITKESWNQVSEEHNARSNSWSVQAIDAAPAVGPQDLEVEEAGAPERFSGRLQRADLSPDGAVEVGEKVARGPAGTTYAGTLDGRPVVIKALSRKYSQHAELHQRVVGSIERAVGFQHEHAVTLLKLERTGGRELLIYEKRGGETLRARLASGGAVLPSQATGWITQLAQALQAAREAGLAHGDVRPEKVLLGPNDDATLTDFGLAEASCLGAGFGRLGLSFGHPDYLAPEILQERLTEPTEKCDVYALGTLYYELICGKAPFTGGDPKQTLRAHLESKFPPPPEDVTLPSRVAELILRMTAKDPSTRLGLLGVLEQIKRCQGLDASAPEGISTAEVDTRGVDVDEFELDSVEEWESHSESMAQTSGEWDQSKIGQAAVGPDEWTPDFDEDDDNPLAAAIREASQPGAATKKPAADEIDFTPGGKTGADPTGKKRVGNKPLKAKKLRKWNDPDQLSKLSTNRNNKQFYTSVAGIAVVCVVLLGLSIRTALTEPPPPESTGQSFDGSEFIVASNVPEPKEAQQGYAKAQAFLNELEGQIATLVVNGDFLRAKELRNTIPDDLSGRGMFQALVARLDSQIEEAEQNELSRAQERMQRAVELGHTDQAVEIARGVLAWAPERAEELNGMLVAARAERDGPIQALRTARPFTPGAIHGNLERQLRGWKREFLLPPPAGSRNSSPQGGVCMQYFPAGTDLLHDLRLVHGPEPKGERSPLGEGQAVRVSAEGQAVLLVLDLPLQRLHDASLELVFAKPPEDGSHVVLFAGSPAFQTRGYGMDLGVVPTLVAQGPTTQVLETRRIPRVTRGSLQRLQVRAIPLEGTGGAQFELTGSLEDLGRRDTTAGASAAVFGSTRGRVGIYVENADLWITGLEIRGVIDPEAIVQ